MQIPSRPRGTSLPLPVDGGAQLFDADALISIHHKRATSVHINADANTSIHANATIHTFPRRGSTSNCSSRQSRRRRSSAGNTTNTNSNTNSNRSSRPVVVVEDHDSPDAAPEPVFFVEDDNVAVLSESLGVATNGGSRRPYGKPNRPHRSTSMPLQRGQDRHAQLSASGRGAGARLRHTELLAKSAKMKRHKMVAFKNVHEPEVMPETRAPVQSYDELLFNVAGLYHTLSYLHDADYLDDGSATDSSTSSSSNEPPPPMERSMQLMIAEFLYRSAVYLGYPPEKDVWLPGFRESKKFSSNDVKRWRRLAHFDWDKEERDFALEEAQRHARSRVSSRVSTRMSSRASYRTSSTFGLRATVTNWLNIGRGSSRDHSPTSAAAAAIPIKYAPNPKPLPPLMLEPPLVPSSADLSKLVEIANSCISFGGFRFSERQIRKLCNVPIRK